MDNSYAKDTRALALDHIEAAKAAADTDGLSSAVEAGLKLAEVYALLAIRDAIVGAEAGSYLAELPTTTGGRLLAAGGVDYSSEPPC